MLLSWVCSVVDGIATTSLGSVEEGESENNFVIIISNKICTWVHGISSKEAPKKGNARWYNESTAGLGGGAKAT